MKKQLMKRGAWTLGWEREFSYSDLKNIGNELELMEKEVGGYQYWKSWKEPSFVLRDLYDKFHRRNPFRELFFFRRLGKRYERLWQVMERRWGHYFLQNIIIVFEKR